jgi:hypothetical protein
MIALALLRIMPLKTIVAVVGWSTFKKNFNSFDGRASLRNIVNN